MTAIDWVILVTFLITPLCTIIIVFNFDKENKRLRRKLDTYRSTYQQIKGYLSGFGEYDFRTFDGGKQWYTTLYSQTEGLTIEGSVESTYPGLMRELREKNGFAPCHVEEDGPTGDNGAITNRGTVYRY